MEANLTRNNITPDATVVLTEQEENAAPPKTREFMNTQGEYLHLLG